MLRLKPLEPTKRVVNIESGAAFTIEKLSATEYQSLRKQSTVGGQVDSILFSKKAAAKIIKDWERVDGECTDANKAAFGAAFAFNIVPWLIDEAMELQDMIQEETDEGKGS